MRIELHVDETLRPPFRLTGRAIWVLTGVLFLVGMNNGDGGVSRFLDVVFFSGVAAGLVFIFRHYVLEQMLVHWVEAAEYRRHFYVVGAQLVAIPILLFLPVDFALKFLAIAAVMLSHALACDAWLRGNNVTYLMRGDAYGGLDRQNLLDSTAFLGSDAPFSPALSLLKHAGIVLALIGFIWLNALFAEESRLSADGLPGIALLILLIMTSVYARRRAQVIDAASALALVRKERNDRVAAESIVSVASAPSAEARAEKDEPDDSWLDYDEEDEVDDDLETEELSDEERAEQLARAREYFDKRVVPEAEWLESVKDLAEDFRFFTDGGSGPWGRTKLIDHFRRGEKWGYDWRSVYKSLRRRRTRDGRSLPTLKEMEATVSELPPSTTDQIP